MKTREIVLLALLFLGGTAVVAVAWHLLFPSQPEAGAGTASAKPAAASADMDSQRNRIEKKSTPSKKAESKKIAASGVPFDEAMKLALSDPDRRNRFRSIMDLIKKLEASEIPAALVYAATLEGREKDMMQRMIVGRWGSLDPQAALAYASSLPDKTQAADAQRSAVYGWANTDPSAALTYVKNLPPGDARSQLLGTSISVWGESDPWSASTYIATLSPADQALAASRLAGVWASNDRESALNWATSLTDDNARGSAYQSLMPTWARQDPASAADFVQTLPPGVARDDAILGLAPSLTRTDPDKAIAWAQAISDPQTRTTGLEQVAGSWLSRDKTSALNWLSQTDQLSPEVKQVIINLTGDNGGRGFRGGFGGPPFGGGPPQ